MMKCLDMPPDALALMESTRAIGYSLATAVADVIDNSIAAKASMVKIVVHPMNDAYVAILDNGLGMDGKELDQAMKYGGHGPHERRCKGDLGRFGLGLKTASLSQCDCLTVITKKDDQVEGRCWDLEHIRKTNSWSLLVLGQEQLKKMPCYNNLCAQECGTLVIWQRLDRLCQGGDVLQVLTQKMIRTQGHLALVFHRYLKGEAGLKTVEMYMNNEKILPSSPFLAEKGTKAADTTVQTIRRGERITAIPYLLPHPNGIREKEKELLGITSDLQQNQGFYVYRNKRLIIWGTWFHKIPKDKISKLSRIQVDVPSTLDDQWMLDVKKSSAVPPKMVIERLEGLVENISQKSRRTWEHRGKRETDKNIEHIWVKIKERSGGIRYEINEKHPLTAAILEENPQSRRKLKSLLHLIEGMLPLNQMLLDANSASGQLENEDMISRDYAAKALSLLLTGIPAARLDLVKEQYKKAEPFCNYPELFD